MKNTIDNLTCCYENEMPDNCAYIDLNTKVLRHGDYKLSDGQVKDIISFMSHKLLDFSQNGGDMSNLSAKGVFAFLERKNKEFSSSN